MKKSLKKLELKKQTISDLNLNKIKGGIDPTHCCPTLDALNSCPPPGMQCF
ncbi:hypothetical protein [uncultured Aquimarina sp.]|uniref:hypothetical protein n=1 Tax=uncultured Aquimarina sp. TaxID=575652 RepID=UPI002601F64A|nr:hypothetical protein [uncultured Aquimarina sp.]